MAGPDSIRGFNFQHAVALHATLDLLDDPGTNHIELEGEDDVIDFQVADSVGTRLRVAQVKSRSANVGPQEIIDVIKRWKALGPAATFEFITDARLGPQANAMLAKAVDRLGAGRPLDQGLRDYLVEKDIDEDELLAKVRLVTGHPPVGALLNQAEVRVAQILGGHRATSLDEATTVVDRLFVRIAVSAGEGERNLRRLSRADVAEALGLSLEAIDAGGDWTAERAEAYRAAIPAAPESVVALGVSAHETGVPALRLVASGSRSSLAQPASAVGEVLDEEAGAAVVGPGGSGKTTSLGLLARLVADSGALPIVPDVVAYQAGSLRRLLHRRVEEMIDGPLAPRALEGPLAAGQVVVLIDGVTERPAAEAESLIVDLRALCRDWPVRLIATARRTTPLLSLDLPIYQLDGLDWAGREHLAVTLAGEQEGPALARALGDRLGSAVENPLLFVMGLSLAQQGVDPRSLHELYDEFVSGLSARSGQDRPELELLAAGVCAIQLVAAGRFEADRYWWLAAVRKALDALPPGLFEADAVSAEAVIDRLAEIGLMTVRGAAGQFAFLHDSFRDFLAASALGRGAAALPHPMDERFEHVARFLVTGAVQPSQDLLRRLCDNPVAAAHASELELPVDAPPRALAEELLVALLGGYPFPAASLPQQPALSWWNGGDRVYVALHGGEGRDCESTEELGAVPEPLLIMAFAEPPSALRVALLIWQELLRAELERLGRLAPPEPIPSDRQALAEALGTFFESMRASLTELAEALCPAFRERIVEEVGWRGLLARLGEGLPTPWEDVAHSLTYTHDTDVVTVELSEAAPNQDDELRFAARTTAEHFMFEAPRTQAVGAIEKALGRLLATWGPG